ncbi:MAG: PD-(D/E)XK nuclease family protein [Spirochaetales bacterium]|nr:PD-(D/E)XK nuclease family protein [Spirochaetales bacterium]
MKTIFSIIKDNLNHADHFFVFPSEIAAGFYRHKAFDFTDAKTVLSGQFISWDDFKQKTFQFSTKAKPANNINRIFFLNGLLAGNTETPVFKELIRREFASQSNIYAGHLKKMLPVLNGMETGGVLSDSGPISRDKKADLRFLFNKYRDFLETHSLFEPNYLVPAIDTDGLQFILFFPEVIDDYRQYSGLISGQKNIKIIPLHEQTMKQEIKITSFENSLHEIRWLFHEIKNLLKKGVRSDEIGITIGGTEELDWILRNEAKLRGITLYEHKGRQLSSFAVIILFRHLKECHDSGFSFDSLKNLLLNASIPLKNREAADHLIAFGIRYKCIKNYHYGQQTDIWEVNFKKAEENDLGKGPVDAIRHYYRNINKRISAIIKASDFEELKDAIDRFLNQFFIIEGMEWETYKILRFALKQLDELTLAHKKLGEPVITDCYALWLQYMDEKIYVPVRPLKGISVYPYRVSAGIFPDYHFIINASQDNTRHILNSFPFLNQQEQKALKIKEEDLTADFLKLYSESGKNVSITCSKRNLSGTLLPPGFFITHGIIDNFTSLENIGNADPFIQETELWSGRRNDALAEIYPAQFEGYTHACSTVFKKKIDDYTLAALDRQGILPLIKKRLSNKDGVYEFNYSKLESYAKCPFGFLLEYALGIEEYAGEIEFFSPLEWGLLLHSLLERLCRLRESAEGTGAQILEAGLKQALGKYRHNHPVPIKPVWTWIEAKAAALASVFMDKDDDEFDGYSLHSVEFSMSHMIREDRVKLRGRIDRIIYRDDKYTIIDYKRSGIPSAGDIFGEAPGSFQMPLYYYLAGKVLQETVSQVAYYNIEEGRYRFIYDGDGKRRNAASRETMEKAAANVEKYCIDMADRLDAGEFFPKPPYNRIDCRYCTYRGVCRLKYVLG